ncbi:nitrogen regulation protein NR(II) [Kangiella japonica]|uniref:Sensory histidine kinase/phosphatase NtrB n=1 Tax=Kangiella japonica TaxID=647384 RepID=A0ABN0SXX3_9GAMM
MRFERLLDNLSTSVILFDAHGRFQYLNQAAEKAFNTSNKVLKGKRYSYFIASDSLPLAEILEALRQNGQFVQDNIQLQLLNGKELSVDISGNWFMADEPFLLVEWQSSQYFRNRSFAQGLSKQTQVSERLLQNLAHEIKTPLSGIRGAAQLLSQETTASSIPNEVSQGIGELSTIIQKETERLTQLVNRMLLSTQKATRVMMNIHETTEQVIDLCQLNLPSNITLTRDYDPSLPEFMCAPDSVYQAILNITQNAIEACHEQDDATITLRTRALPRHTIGETQYPLTLCVQVENNGPAIDPKLQPNIFFPLISGKSSSGLGLGIAQSLIQQQQGLIEFNSSADKTCFSIYLPVVSQEELKPSVAATTHQLGSLDD